MLIARNLEYSSQVQSTIRYSRKLAALGRLSAGVAHEVKNPLNAMMIHLELLRQQFAPRGRARRARARRRRAVGAVATRRAARRSIDRGAAARRRDRERDPAARRGRPGLPEVHAARGSQAAAGQRWRAVRRSRADRAARGRRAPASTLVVECDDAPDVNGDPAMLRQAFLNLALNACQAMPNGGTLRIPCEAARGRRVAVVVRRHRRRHQARAPAADLRSVFHDQGERQRHRAVDGVPHGADARRRDRSAVDARRGTTFRVLAAAGVGK